MNKVDPPIVKESENIKVPSSWATSDFWKGQIAMAVQNTTTNLRSKLLEIADRIKSEERRGFISYLERDTLITIINKEIDSLNDATEQKIAA